MKNNSGQFTKGEHWRERKPWWDKEWLYDQYISCGKSAGEIANEGGITENGIFYWLQKHGIKRRTIKEVRRLKHWGLSGADNPMWNKRGELNPMWKGGVTPDRQAFYTSEAWRKACSAVWKRDNATCQRCGEQKQESPDTPFHIHHITSFANEQLRAEPQNLVLLCETCHHFVHSKKNTNREYLPKS